MKTNKIFIILSLVVLLFANSCIREELDECPLIERHICFESAMHKYNFAEIIDQTTLYLYNSEKELVFSRIYTAEELVMNNYMASIPLQEADTYTLLASMNSGNDYQKAEALHLHDFSISLIPDKADSITRKQTDIYHGFREIVFTENEQPKQICDKVTLYKNTNHINITLVYDGYIIPEAHMLQAKLEANNGMYNHFNENTGNGNRIYIAHNEESISNGNYYNFTVMHIKSQLPVSLYLEEVNADGIVHAGLEKDLIKEITKIYQTDEDLDQEDIFDIKITLGDRMTIISLLVNGWYTIRDGVDI